jgi:hypothetical protein
MSDVEDYINKYIKEEKIRMFSTVFYISFLHFYPTSKLDEKHFISEFKRLLKTKNLHRCLGNIFLQISIKNNIVPKPATDTATASKATIIPILSQSTVQKRKRSFDDDDKISKNVKLKTDES